ncbi:MAG TPA: GNAT family N-acetyltransferase [Aeromicrobium sp.]|jgi:GNAT superfamily N-acetyltransferase|nr:GNAT family N-acetyltransferase [Aeromicrobium sp.]HKY57221.1 GNAT family N-acetyltransferase [Aeromicrobium sp.]
MILSTPDPALDRAFAAALLRLQHDAYRSQAELIGDDRLNALAADENSLPAWRGRYVVAWEGTHLIGAVAWHPGRVIEVDRVMVDAPVRRRGVAAALLRVVLDQAGDAPVETVTGRDNAPGISLYRRLGFEPVAEEQAPTGIWVTRLRRG